MNKKLFQFISILLLFGLCITLVKVWFNTLGLQGTASSESILDF